MQKFRAGDVVTIFATVTQDFDPAMQNRDDFFKGKVRLAVEEHHQGLFVAAEKVTLVTPVFRQGERVRKTNDHKIGGTVIATMEDAVWVNFDHGKKGTVPATELEIAA